MLSWRRSISSSYFLHPEKRTPTRTKAEHHLNKVFGNVRFINLNFNCAFFVFSDNSMLSFMRKSLIQYQLANKQYFIVSSKYFYFLRESGKNILQCKRNGFSNRLIGFKIIS